MNLFTLPTLTRLIIRILSATDSLKIYYETAFTEIYIDYDILSITTMLEEELVNDD